MKWPRYTPPFIEAEYLWRAELLRQATQTRHQLDKALLTWYANGLPPTYRPVIERLGRKLALTEAQLAVIAAQEVAG